MNNILICSALPTYESCSISLDILKNDSNMVLKAIESKSVENNYILIGEKDKSIIPKLQEELSNFPNLNLKIVTSDDNFHFVYTNESAALKAVNNENPIPRNKENNNILFSIEELCNYEEKRVFITGKVIESKSYSFSKKTTGKEILDKIKVKGEFKSMYLGFPMGIFITEKNLNDEIILTTDKIEVFNETDCMLAKLKIIAENYEKETCGRCVFGFEGVTQINMILSDILNKKGKVGDLDKLKQLSLQMTSHTLCDVDNVLASSLLNALDLFHDEINNHITKKVCEAMECNKFVTFHILASKCTGCGECIDSCKDEAIIGKNKFVHVIVEDDCTQCGKCLSSCEEGAIVKAGATKPKCPTKPIPCKK